VAFPNGLNLKSSLLKKIDAFSAPIIALILRCVFKVAAGSGFHIRYLNQNKNSNSKGKPDWILGKPNSGMLESRIQNLVFMNIYEHITLKNYIIFYLWKEIV
jgi:hypothetical protein